MLFMRGEQEEEKNKLTKSHQNFHCSRIILSTQRFFLHKFGFANENIFLFRSLRLDSDLENGFDCEW